jgi:hypothetical protein
LWSTERLEMDEPSVYGAGRSMRGVGRGALMNITRMKKLLLRIAATAVLVFASYLALLCFPQSFFDLSVGAQNLTLYSDQSFSPEAGKKVLEIVLAKLETSPLFSPQQHHTAFICNARWRQRLFFNRNYGVGGVNYYPITANVFLRDAVVEENHLISPSGNPVPGDRTLDYFIAHEITHTLTVNAVGWLRYHRLPEWVREGYADYVAKGKTFNYEEAREAFLNEAAEMNRQKSGLYLRYHLLVAYMLEKRHWTVERLLKEPVQQQVVEDEIRENRPEAEEACLTTLWTGAR